MKHHDSELIRMYELVEHVMDAPSRSEALSRILAVSEHVVPSDRGAALFTIRHGLPHCIRWPQYADARIEEFNEHYNRIVPVHFTGRERILGPVCWADYGDSEYVTDFHGPLKIDQSVGASFTDTFTGDRYVLWVHREGAAARFSPAETEALRIFCSLCGHAVSLRSELECARQQAIWDPELGNDADVLSRREAEVARLICRRHSMREIGALLGISPRTVERHAFHIYHKLGVSNRKELARVLLSRLRAS